MNWEPKAIRNIEVLVTKQAEFMIALSEVRQMLEILLLGDGKSNEFV